MDMGTTIVNRRMGDIMGVITTIIMEATIAVQMSSCIVSGLVGREPIVDRQDPILTQPRPIRRIHLARQSAHNTVCSGGKPLPDCFHVVSAKLTK